MGFVKRNAGRWENGLIPFVREDAYELSFPNPTPRLALTTAMDEYANKTAIRFQAKQANDRSWVIITNRWLGNWSASGLFNLGGGIGRIGGQQIINTQLRFSNSGQLIFSNGATRSQANLTGTLVHEIGHAVGLFHEHQRPERDDFVEEQGLIKGYHFNWVSYAKLTNRDVEIPIGDYDCNSIMHYREPHFEPSKTGPTPCPVPPGVGRLNFRLRRGDKAAVNFLYPLRRMNSVGKQPSWMAAPFSMSSSQLCFWFQPSNGNVEITELIPGGENLLERLTGYFSTKTTHITTLYSSSRSPYILRYESSTGIAELFSITTSYGKIQVNSVASRVIGVGVTLLAPFRLGARAYFLAYNRTSGEAQVFTMSEVSNTTEIHSIWQSSNPWARNWSHISISVETSTLGTETPFIWAYSTDTGHFAFARFRFGPNLPFQLFATSSIPLFPRGDLISQFYTHLWKDYLFTLNSRSGRLQIWEIQDGPNWVLIGETTWRNRGPFLAAGWDTFIPYTTQDSNGDTHLWYQLYDSASGETQFGRIYAMSLQHIPA